MSEYIATLERNPYKLARLHLKMTQSDVARALGVTTQMVYRHENGLVGEPSEGIGLLFNIKLNFTGESDIQFADEYKLWVSEMRSSVAEINSDPREFFYGPYDNMNHLRDGHPFLTFMYNFNSLTGRLDYFALPYPNGVASIQLFNRLLCISPRCVELYLASRYNNIDNILHEALLEVGVEEEIIHSIEYEVGLWQVRNQ